MIAAISSTPLDLLGDDGLLCNILNKSNVSYYVMSSTQLNKFQVDLIWIKLMNAGGNYGTWECSVCKLMSPLMLR